MDLLDALEAGAGETARSMTLVAAAYGSFLKTSLDSFDYVAALVANVSHLAVIENQLAICAVANVPEDRGALERAEVLGLCARHPLAPLPTGL